MNWLGLMPTTIWIMSFLIWFDNMRSARRLGPRRAYYLAVSFVALSVVGALHGVYLTLSPLFETAAQ